MQMHDMLIYVTRSQLSHACPDIGLRTPDELAMV